MKVAGLSLAGSGAAVFMCILLAGCAKPKPKPAEPLERENNLAVPELAPRATVSDDELNRQRILSEAREIFQTIYFPLDQSTLDAKARYILTSIHRFMQIHPKLAVTVAGHCDERGTEEYNLALGERRAQAVIQYLTDLGVRGTSLKPISYGEEKPAEAGQSESSWAKNRRVEFTVDLGP